MRKIKYYLLTALLATYGVACDNVDFGDLNVNKNGSTEPSTSGLLAGAIMSYATYTGRPGVTIPSLYVQYQSQVTYTDEMQYAETPYTWTTYYNGSVFPLTQIINLNSDTKNHTTGLLANGDPVNQTGVALILRAVVMKRITDVFGDVPFSQAAKGLEVLTPSYDTQESIYKQLILDVKNGRDMLDAAKKAVVGDLIYSGSVAKWKRFANSFLLQASLQLSKVYPSASDYAATEFNAALTHSAGVIQAVADEAWFSHQDLNGFRNPWFANRRTDYFMSAEFINAMNGCQACPTVSLNSTTTKETSNPTSTTVADPRKTSYIGHTQQSAQGVPYGYRTGSGSGKAQMSTRYYWNATSSLPLLTSSYTYLNRAEAAAIGWTSEDAQEMLELGMLRSFQTLQDQSGKTKPTAYPLTYVSDITSNSVATANANVATYITTRIGQIGTVNILQIIGEEKWKTLFGQAFDAWAEFRRTGYPNLVPATDYSNNGEIPGRFLYPNEEAALNPSNYTTAVGRINGGDHNYSKVWWDVD